MNLSHDHLMSISYTHGDAHLRPLDNELTNLKRQIQANKQIISQNKYSVEVGIDDFRLGDVSRLVTIMLSNSRAVNPPIRETPDFGPNLPISRF